MKPTAIIWALMLFSWACKDDKLPPIGIDNQTHETQFIRDSVLTYILNIRGITPSEVIHAEPIVIDTLWNGKQIMYQIQDGPEIVTRYDKNKIRYYAYRQLHLVKIDNTVLDITLKRNIIMDPDLDIDLRFFNLISADLLKEEDQRLYMRLHFAIPETSITVPVIVSISNHGSIIVHHE